MILFPNKVTFWGPGGWDVNICFEKTQFNPWKRILESVFKKKFLVRDIALIYPFSEQMGNSGPGKGWVQSHAETQWQCHNRMPGIITPPASLPIRQTAFRSSDVVVPTLIYEDEHLSGYFQLPMSAHKASFTCPMVSLGASVDPLVLSPVFIMKGKVSARRSTTAVMDPHPAFLPAVPVLVQILVLLNGI